MANVSIVVGSVFSWYMSHRGSRGYAGHREVGRGKARLVAQALYTAGGGADGLVICPRMGWRTRVSFEGVWPWDSSDSFGSLYTVIEGPYLNGGPRGRAHMLGLGHAMFEYSRISAPY